MGRAATDFYNLSTNTGENFSWVFLVVWLLTLFLVPSALFYLSRFVAFCISLVLQWVLWKRLKVKVSLQSFRISLLGGKIFFKNLTIVDKDYTVSFLEGIITWRYWLFKTRETQWGCNNDKVNMKLPCRFILECEGAEIFLYNRTVAYDNIISTLSKDDRVKFEHFMRTEECLSDSNESSNSKYDTNSDSQSFMQPETLGSNSTKTFVNDRVFGEQDAQNQDKDMFLQSLPFELKVQHASLIIGNKFTPSLLIMSADSLNGIIDKCQAKEKLDLYNIKQMVDARNFAISLKQNINYEEQNMTLSSLERNKISKLWKKFIKVTGFIAGPIKHLILKKDEATTDENIQFQRKWRGLSLYRENMFGNLPDLEDIAFDISNHEYAKFTSIVKCPRVIFSYEYDIPGCVPHGAHPTASHLDGPDIGNSGKAPTLELEVQLFGGSICYGPWASRQMDHIKTMMSPLVSRTVKPIKRLSAGSKRVYTNFKISFLIMDDTTLRVPIRESSKDAEFLKHFRETNEDYRSFGWIDWKFAKDSSISSIFALCATEDGTSNFFNIHLENSEIRTSVNHDIFTKAASFDFEIALEYPLVWNQKAQWTFVLKSNQLEAFFLREHITLIADTISDFSSGEPTPYELFRPIDYDLRWIINGYSLYLNVNDHNIVNNPLDFNENCYISFHGDELDLSIFVPNDNIGERYTTIKYEVSTPMFRLLLNTPPWNTLNEFMKQKEVGRSYDFKIKSTYILYNELNVDNVDTLTIDCTSTSTMLFCYGYVIRYFINVKMNYFGDFFHFVTSEEYTGEISTKENVHLPESYGGFDDMLSMTSNVSDGDNTLTNKDLSPSDLRRMTNETDVWLTFTVCDGALILPETIYNYTPVTALHFDELCIDVRSSNYYMDLLATLDEVYIRRYLDLTPNILFEKIHKNAYDDLDHQGYLSSLSIHGHRIYGLPPSEPTYFCKWDFDLGNFSIDSDVDFFKGFISSFQKIGFGFSDLENVLLYETDTIHDMTSVTVRLERLDFILRHPDGVSSFKLVLDGFKFTNIDFENEKYSTRMDVRIPRLELTFAGKDDGDEPVTFFKIETKLNFTDFCKYRNHAAHRKSQIDYIMLNDAPFHRCAFLLPESKQNSELYRSLHGCIVPSSSLPPLPLPLTEETVELITNDFIGSYDMLTNEIVFGSHFSDSRQGIRSISYNRQNSSLDPLERTISMEQSLTSSESDNFIVDIFYVSMKVNPNLKDALSHFMIAFNAMETEQLIDDIEIGIVKRLSNLQEGLSTIDNIKLRIYSVDLFYGDRTTGAIEIYLDTVDLELNEKFLEKNREKKLVDMVVLTSIKNIRSTINERYSCSITNERPPALSFMIENLTFWSSPTGKQVSSIDLACSDMAVDESQIFWLFTFFNRQKELISNMVTRFEKIQSDRVAASRELISRITAASEYYQISHDPYVITKPAFIMRLSRGHVRENRSWKIITRLRHIMTYLPPDWDSNITKRLRERNFDLSQDAKGIFMSVFSTWRNWEFSDIARSYIYGKLFQGNQDSKETNLKGKVLKLKVDAFYTTIYTAGYGVDHEFVVTGSDLFFEEAPHLNEFGIPTDSITNISGNFGKVKVKVSDKIFQLSKLLDLMKPGSDVPTNEDLMPMSTGHTALKINAAIMFTSCDLLFEFGHTDLSLSVKKGKMSLFYEQSIDSPNKSTSIVFYTVRNELLLKHRHKMILESQITGLSLTVAGESLEVVPTLITNLQCDDIHFKMMPETDILANFIKELLKKSEEVKEALALSVDTATTPKEQESNDTLHRFDADISCLLSNVSVEIMPISPIQFRSETKKLEIFFNFGQITKFGLNVWDSDLYIGSHLTKQQYLRFSLGDTNMNLSIIFKPSIMVHADYSASVAKLTFSEPHRLFFSFIQDEKIASSSAKTLLSLKSLIVDTFGSKAEVPVHPATPRVIHWSADLDIKYFGLLIPISTTFFVLEMHSFMSSLSNVSEKDITVHRNDILGNLSIDSVLFFIKDRAIAPSLSKMVDLSLKVSTIQKSSTVHNSIQVESSHFRVSLSPSSLIRLIWGGHQILTLYEYYRKKHSTRLWAFLDDEAVTDSSPQKASETSNLFASFKLSSCHILSYKFCIGWLFQDSTVNEQGLILGYNRLFSAYEKNYGKLTVVDAFFAVANGGTSDTFYPTESVEFTYNRSYLPNLQIMYWLKPVGNMKDVFIRLHGEALDVNFLTSFLNVVESLLRSIQLFQDLKKAVIKPLNQFSEPKQTSGSSTKASDTKVNNDSSSLNIAPFLSDIRMVNCQFNYDGGVFKVYSLEDIDAGLEPSFEIKSPRVVIDLDYKNDEQSAKPHWIRTLITIHSTYNILSARCAPLIKTFSLDIQNMVKKHSSKKKSQSLAKNPSQTIDYKRLLDAFDIAFMIRSAEQKLSLSCEPKAKVQADVGFDSFEFSISTNNLDETEPLSFSFILQKTNASIRHIFSREASTSFNLDLVDLTFMFTHSNIISMYGVGLVSDVDVYFNVKQLQNLYLFLDIWKLSDFLRSKPMKQPKETKITPGGALSFSQLSDANELIPWCFTLIFKNILGKVDLGPSLGVLTVNLRKAWIASDHYEDGRHLLNVCMDSGKIESEGRLGGVLEIKGASWIAEVNWSTITEISSHPLVAISLNVDNIAMKFAFDYHMFLIGTIDNTRVHIHSERDITENMPDLLVITLSCEAINLSSTALVVANLYDIYNTLLRMKQDNNISYLETLHESSAVDAKEVVNYTDILKMLNLIQTDVAVDICTFNVQISPISLADMDVAVFNIENISAHVKTLSGEKLATHLDLELLNSRCSLSNPSVHLNEDQVSKISIKEYMEYARQIRGGLIIDVPKLIISMHTWQKSNSDVLEYIFNSTFDDMIAVKWNLGPVNFIKEMWTTHVKALAVRRSQTISQAGVGHHGDDVEKRIKEEEDLLKLVYIALEEPHIDMPQIRDLGNATPPLEWFGVNRKRFPSFTHQAVMVPVQKLIHTAEHQYARVIGRSQ